MRPRPLLALLCLLGVLLALFVPLPAGVAQAATLRLSGPDVASYQHPNGALIDWAAVRRSGQAWGFVKATEGTTYTNPYFAGDWSDIAAAGLYRGSYHYARPNPTAGSASAQAAFFARTLGPQRIPGTLPPILDLEDDGGLSSGALQSWVQTFLDEVQARTGRVPMIYTYPNFWKTRMAGSTAFLRYPLWIANYQVSSPQTIGWPTYTFWQYTSTATVDGIATPGGTDVSFFNGTALDLAVLAMTGTWGPPSTTAADLAQPGAPSAVSRYVALPPQRVVDTRGGLGAPAGPVNGSVTVTLPETVPADSTGVVLDVSAVQATGRGFLRVAPNGSAPQTTALNYDVGRSTTGLVVTSTDAQRKITLSTYGTPVDLTVDVVGYYTAATGVGGHWSPLTPVRVADSRTGLGVPAGKASGAVTITLPGGVPTTAAGVVLDVTALGASGPGFLRLAAQGAPATTTALNYDASGSTTGLAITSVSNGKLSVTVYGAPTYLVVDLIGFYEGAASSGSGYVGLTPERFLDTRVALGASGPGTGPLSLTVPSSVPADATAVLLDVSAVEPDGNGFVRLAAPGTEAMTTAVNTVRARSVTGLVITGVRERQITLAMYGANTHLVVDLVGYQTAPTSGPSPSATPTP